jgi:IclR family mhp operon transcriptional activator
MPLKLNGRVLATFGVTYFRSAVAERDLMARIVEPLRTAVANIEREIAQLGAVREPTSGG